MLTRLQTSTIGNFDFPLYSKWSLLLIVSLFFCTVGAIQMIRGLDFKVQEPSKIEKILSSLRNENKKIAHDSLVQGIELFKNSPKELKKIYELSIKSENYFLRKAALSFFYHMPKTYDHKINLVEKALKAEVLKRNVKKVSANENLNLEDGLHLMSSLGKESLYALDRVLKVSLIKEDRILISNYMTKVINLYFKQK